jgi:Mg2+/Co2+ transporter CorB
MRTLQASEHTRLPVWREDINNIEGILHMRNISRIVTEKGLDRDALLREMEGPYFVPENTPLHTQLLNFQKQKLRLGTVVDEYGDVMGLVALEDILEEIVGEFTSSLIDQDDYITAERDGSYTILGNASIRDVNKALNWTLPTEGPRTISGLILEVLEAFPEGNTSLALEEHCLEILSLDSNVIQAVRAFKKADASLESLS